MKHLFSSKVTFVLVGIIILTASFSGTIAIIGFIGRVFLIIVIVSAFLFKTTNRKRGLIKEYENTTK
jgi:uncharacterized Tic20 family protein